MKSLENQFLIAMPSLADNYFNKTVTYICEHNDEGAMGLIINMPVNITLHDLLTQIEENDNETSAKAATPEESDEQASNLASEENIFLDSRLEQLVLSGGPISQNRGFVLHRTQPGWKSSLALSEDIMITTSKDILSAIGTNTGPDSSIIALGYAGWTAGQLEQEMQDNSWLTIEADDEILFNTPIHKKWQAAVNKLGVDVWQLAPGAGHA